VYVIFADDNSLKDCHPERSKPIRDGESVCGVEGSLSAMPRLRPRKEFPQRLVAALKDSSLARNNRLKTKTPQGTAEAVPFHKTFAWDESTES
jgi:hypothetical protein